MNQPQVKTPSTSSLNDLKAQVIKWKERERDAQSREEPTSSLDNNA